MASKSSTSGGRQNETRKVLKMAATKAATRVKNCIDGKDELTTVQFNACKLAINKFVPDLRAVELKHTDSGGLQTLKELMELMQASPVDLLSEEPAPVKRVEH